MRPGPWETSGTSSGPRQVSWSRFRIPFPIARCQRVVEQNSFRFESASSVLSNNKLPMSTRSSAHPSLPAPVFQSGATSIQSKSRVLAGVQDAYWSDDEAVRVCSSCSPMTRPRNSAHFSRSIDTRKTKNARSVSRRWTSLT